MPMHLTLRRATWSCVRDNYQCEPFGPRRIVHNRVMPRRAGLLAILLLAAARSILPQSTLTGTLRRITDERVVIQTDKSNLTVVLGITTKYYKGSPSGTM